MFNLKIEANSGTVRDRKEERLVYFSEQHREALIAALAYADVRGLEAEAVVDQLRRLTESGAQMIADKHAGAFAISRVNWARRLMDKFEVLPDELNALDGKSERYFYFEVGHSLSGKMSRSARRKEGRRAVQLTADVADHIVAGAAAASEQAIRQVFEGGNDRDQSLREFCRAVYDCWKSATSRPLPSVALTLRRFECWEYLKVGVPNPLWVVLDSLGINIGKSALNCLVAYANGEALESVRYY